MPRRVPEHPDAFAGWNAVAPFGSYISAFSILLFFYIIYITLTDGEKTPQQINGNIRKYILIFFYIKLK
jgi:cytochrome c oxidase subunit 1